MEYVPIALACGHLVTGPAMYRVPAAFPGLPAERDGRTRVECPEGCGWQEFVVEPDLGDLEANA